MIIRKRMKNNKRSASAWINNNETGISFGVTDYQTCLGYIDSDDNGNATIFVIKKSCENANINIKIIE